MTPLSYAAADSATMLRRNLRHMLRYPAMTAMLLGVPVIFLLIFVYVFGGTLGAGLGHVSDGRAAYISYVIPGIIMLTVASAAQATAVSVAMDMTTGIIARFRTMAIARASVLTGHVLGSMIQSVIGIAVIIGIALAVGFRPSAGARAWLAAIGLLVLTAFALTWLSVAFGLVSKTVETASNLPMFLMLLPFLGSGFVPTAVPAVHPGHPDAARLARGRPDRLERHHRGRLGGGDRAAVLPVGEEAIQASPAARQVRLRTRCLRSCCRCCRSRRSR